ncbi:hypothetical protein D9M70_524920 [compost metagenome]
MPVGHCQRVGITHVDLFLPGRRLALGIFDRDAGALQAVADRPHHIFFLGGLEDVVVLVVAADELQVAIAGLAGIVVGLVEQEEFELARHVGLEPHLLEPRHLLLQDRARRVRHFLVGVMVEHVAKHERRAFEPGNAAKCRKVRLHRIVAVALLPARRLVAGNGLHLHVGRKQIVAAMRFLPGAVDEELRVEALAHQPALHVDLAGENRIDAPGGDVFLQLIKRIAHQLPSHVWSRGRSLGSRYFWAAWT